MKNQTPLRGLLVLALVGLLIPPAAGQASSKRSPVRNFEQFWQTFNQRYAHFETREVDWQQQYRTFRPLVTETTPDDSLFALLNRMVAPLRDGHVVISKTGDLPASARYSRFYQEFPTKQLQRRFREVTLNTLSQQGFGPLTKFNSQPYDIGGYTRSADYGFIVLNGFGGMPAERFAAQLDQMVEAFANVKGIVLDIRINGGGAPDLVAALVGRLTDTKRLIGYGRTRISGKKHEFTAWNPYYLVPQGKKQLLKPLVLLTSGGSISAADHCAFALRELPYVRVVGEPTNGMFSSMRGEKLPNGWEFSLSDQQVVNAARVRYEGTGVPVDMPRLHYRRDLEAGRDPVLAAAFQVLAERGEHLQAQTRCYEQLALNFFADSLLPGKTYGDVTAYSTGLVEEDATLLAPFASACLSLRDKKSSDLMVKVRDEQRGDSRFFRENVRDRLYVTFNRPVRSRKTWPFTKRNARRLTISHHIELDEKRYVRLNLSAGAWRGESVLIVMNPEGRVLEHCAIRYEQLSTETLARR